MARVSENRAVGETGTADGGAWDVLDRHVGAWIPIAWKFAVLYAVWIGFAMLVRSQASAPEILQLAAILYWFGLLFALVTVVLGAFVVATEWLDRHRLRSQRRA
jgi:uncharacterized membrane protein YcjF (UPF0283 family)